MACSPAALVALLVASCAAVAAATTFDVGDGHGWETGVDYAAWTSDKTFAVGDTLVFNYTKKAHTVTEVSESGYESCAAGNSLSNDDSGATTVTLTTAGLHYFICGIPGHCASGMKLAVTVTVAGGGIGSTTTGGLTPPAAAAASLHALPAMGAAVVAGALILITLALF